MRYNTNNPVGTDGSSDPRDLYDNAGNLDLISNSQTLLSVPDRLGQPRTTFHGYEVKANAVIDSMGMYRLADQTFGTGTTITSNKQLLLWAVEDGGTGWHYYWSAEIPSGGKVVPPDSTPAITGGEGPGGWLVWDDLEQRIGDVESDFLIAGQEAQYVAQGNLKGTTLRPVFGELDAMSRIQAALADFDVVYVMGNLPIASINPTVLTNKKLLGFRGLSSLTYDVALTGVVWIVGVESTIDGISHIGPMPEPDVTDGVTYAATADEAFALKGIGTLSCIKVQSQSSKVSKNEFTGFSKWCVETSKNNVLPNSKAVDTNIVENRMTGNYGCIDIPEESEYMKFSLNTMCWNIVGINKAGGNNVLVANNLDHNRIHYITRGGANDSHGGLTGGTINHGKLISILARDIVNGEAISGVNMFDSGPLGIWIENCVGLNINGNLLGRVNIHCVGRSTSVAGAPGVNTIRNNLTKEMGVTYQFRRNWNKTTGASDPATPDNCIFRNNNHMEGQSSRDGSNWDEVILNDRDAPDEDDWLDRITVAGNNNSRYAAGRPLDATKYLGDGNQTGAIAVVLGAASMNNSNFEFKISCRPSNGLGFELHVSAFISNAGTWGNPVVKLYGGVQYPVRFGRTAGNRPVVYIGDLTTIWASALVEVLYMSSHAGALVGSMWWKRNWLVSLESSAFSNVSQTLQGGPTYTGDLNNITHSCELYVGASASNLPPSVGAGFCNTLVRVPGSPIMRQRYETVDNKLFIRNTTTGSGGYNAWTEKT